MTQRVESQRVVVSCLQVEETLSGTKGSAVALFGIQPVVSYGGRSHHHSNPSAERSTPGVAFTLYRAASHQVQGRCDHPAAVTVAQQADGCVRWQMTNQVRKIPAIAGRPTSQQIDVKFVGGQENGAGTRPFKFNHLNATSVRRGLQPSIGRGFFLPEFIFLSETPMNVNADRNTGLEPVEKSLQVR